jgi:hypothetical protein
MNDEGTRNTVGAVSITNAKSITKDSFAAVFTVKKIFF